MASLKSICELAWRQMFPHPNDEVLITKEEFIETGKAQYAWEMWRLSKEQKREEGVFNMPSNLLTEIELPVSENTVDISELNILRSITDDAWLVNIGGLTSKCKYVASNVNLTQLLDEDDSLPDSYRTFVVIGNKIKFPKGTHSDPLSIIYVNNGLSLEDDGIEIDDMIAAIIRTKLIDIYTRKGQADETNNSNPEK